MDRIKYVNHSDKRLLSFDVVSLFTNVPLTETVSYICDFINEHKLNIGIPTHYLKEIILRCTLNIQFCFNNNLYRQIDGVAMGSPLGPVLADCFMAKLENTVLSGAIKQLTFYSRFMDDTFIMCDNDVDIDKVLELFNTAHPSVSFTMSEEQNGEIPFLDVLLIRKDDGYLQRRMYRKMGNHVQYTNFQSWVPLHQKRNLIKSVSARIFKICSPDVIDQELTLFRTILHENGYPDKFINKHLQAPSPKTEQTAVPKKHLFLTLPFKTDADSELLGNRLRRAIKRTYHAADLRLTFSNSPMFSTCVKDKLPKEAISMCIYEFTCSCGATYIGRTKRRLSMRIREHLPTWFCKGEIRSVTSSILEHLLQTDHTADPDKSFKIIYKVPCKYSKRVQLKLLCTAEALAIHYKTPSLCIQKKYVQSLLLPWT